MSEYINGYEKGLADGHKYVELIQSQNSGVAYNWGRRDALIGCAIGTLIGARRLCEDPIVLARIELALKDLTGARDIDMDSPNEFNKQKDERRA